VCVCVLCVSVCVCVCLCVFVLYCKNTPENELTGEARAASNHKTRYVSLAGMWTRRGGRCLEKTYGC
jgi:hypothetical protein